MPFQLRPYQEDIIDRTRLAMRRDVRRILIQAPTGSGKTCLTAFMIGTAASKGYASWFIVHRRELVKQTMRTFHDVGIRYGVTAAGFPPHPQHRVQICSIQTLANRYPRLRRPDLIIWDECHHTASASWSRVHAAFPDAHHVGLTATPQRLDGTGLARWFDEIVLGPSVAELIRDGWLANYRLFAPSTIDVAGIRVRMGDFVASELAQAVSDSCIFGDAVQHYRKLCSGMRALVFCVSIEHSKEMAHRFCQAGIPAEHVDGDTKSDVRDGAMERFREGRTLILSNCNLFGEGLDVPALEAVILLRPTQSLGLYLQQVGRSLRPSPGKKEAIILDHVGNAQRHGLPDEDREWSLIGAKKRRGEVESADRVRICPKCFAAQLPGSVRCRYCGLVFEPGAREIEEIDGDLVEVDRIQAQRARRMEQGSAESFEDLVALGKQRGHAPGWARHVWNARQAKRLSGG